MKIGFKPNPDNTTHLTCIDDKGTVECDITGDVFEDKDVMAFRTVNGGLFVVYVEGDKHN